MSKHLIDDATLKALKANPFVERATAERIKFTPSFVEFALVEYLEAKRNPMFIFAEAGIDVEAVGKERLLRLLKNWAAKRAVGLPVGLHPGQAALEAMDKVQRLEAEHKRLTEVLEIYRQVYAFLNLKKKKK